MRADDQELDKSRNKTWLLFACPAQALNIGPFTILWSLIQEVQEMGALLSAWDFIIQWVLQQWKIYAFTMHGLIIGCKKERSLALL